jgi:hypothetical protein
VWLHINNPAKFVSQGTVINELDHNRDRLAVQKYESLSEMVSAEILLLAAIGSSFVATVVSITDLNANSVKRSALMIGAIGAYCRAHLKCRS